MISRFFIDRPIFASVISIIITLAGLVALKALPLEQYPNITPPQIQVSASYPGASAQIVSDNVAAPIEDQVNGVEDMIYMYSQNTSDGNMQLSVFFNIGSNADLAQINVQNRVNQALPLLPEEVQRTGVTIQKQTPTILLIVAIDSLDGRYDQIFTSNYASINVMTDLQRLDGVSNASIIGVRDYAMRLWLRPDRMAQLGITTNDVVQSVRDQNKSYAIGRIGDEPNPIPRALTLPVTSLGQLVEPEEYDDIILRANPDGSVVQIKDVGRSELGAQNYDVNGQLDGKYSALICIYQQFGANALDVAERVKSTMVQLEKNFPPGLTWSVPYDTTRFIKASITEVAHTILEAAILVVLVVLIFLQNWRATLVPVVAMAVSIIGTFAGMYVLGFSLNTLTLFGLVLAIGIVVDDAIVVIENVERNMREYGYSAREAAQHAMDEVTGPVVAIMFVLCAVFIPVAFLGGIAGELYKQFAITISVSVVFSGIVALTLSPALAALLLKNSGKPGKLATWFNTNFDKFTNLYMKGATWLTHQRVVGIVSFILLLSVLGYLFVTVPTSFVPEEDQGYLMVMNTMPDGSSLNRTQAVDDLIEEIALKTPGVEHTVDLGGYGLMESLSRTNMGAVFVTLTNWSERLTPELQAKAILKKLQAAYSQIKEGLVMVFNPPAIQGLGTVGGFEFWILNQGDATIEQLEELSKKFIEESRKYPELQGLNSSIHTNSMQLYLDVDRYKTRALGVGIGELYQSLQVLLGSLYVNNFVKFGRVFQVVAQAEAQYRETLDDIGDIYIRNTKSQMVPMSALVNVMYKPGPSLISRFNGFVATKIIGSSAPGYSSGEALSAMEKIAEELVPETMTTAWSGESYQERATGGSSSMMLVGGMVMVFLILAALYEKWSLPFAIILAVPFGIFGAFVAVWIRGMPNDVYFQVGLVTLIALAAKKCHIDCRICHYGARKRQIGPGSGS